MDEVWNFFTQTRNDWGQNLSHCVSLWKHGDYRIMAVLIATLFLLVCYRNKLRISRLGSKVDINLVNQPNIVDKEKTIQTEPKINANKLQKEEETTKLKAKIADLEREIQGYKLQISDYHQKLYEIISHIAQSDTAILSSWEHQMNRLSQELRIVIVKESPELKKVDNLLNEGKKILESLRKYLPSDGKTEIFDKAVNSLNRGKKIHE